MISMRSDATNTTDSGWGSGEACPENCTCRAMDYPKYRSLFNKTVVCTGVQFLNNIFPENIPLDVEILDLSHCRLTRLSLRLTLKHLRFLDISYNDLKVMDRQIHKLTALRQLIMRNNSLSYLQNGAFSGMLYLEVLDLSNNQLYSIEPHTFGGLNYLKKLNLEGNRLHFLSPQWFVSMPSLGWLFLSNNLIGRLKANVFEMLSGLFTMKLDENRISYIEPGAFNGLSHLRILYLTDNLLQTIPSQELHNLPLLQYLYFDKNPVLRIPTLAFHSMNLRRYSCEAQSVSGFDTESSVVTVNNKPVRISAEYVAGNFITISWNGTRNQWSMTGYEIHYKPMDNSEKFQIIPLDHRLRQFRYTFTNLSPLTTYMFCIVYVFETELYTVHCTNITTGDEDLSTTGITHINSKMIVGVVTSIFILLILGCCVLVVRRVGKRKDYLEPLYSKDTESLIDVIPLESMYQGQTTPAACSSRTSLIQSQD
uniref:Leucine-rich repeat-containing protein 15 n=1 Tax=Magallana gigas TaxID=29159 RepID=K1R147_MAGGI